MAASFLWVSWSAPAQPASSSGDLSDPEPPGRMRDELTRMLKARATGIADANRDGSLRAAASQSPAPALVMSPYIIREAKIPEIIELANEMPLVRWLKDGTLYYANGKKFTTRIKLTFYQTEDSAAGNIKPVSGIRLEFGWSW